jgi:hypothetical protein
MSPDRSVTHVPGRSERFDSAGRTNELLREALKLPDNYEDVIEYPRPLPDTVSEILDGKKRQDDSEQND